MCQRNLAGGGRVMSQVCDADTFKKLQSGIYRRIDETGRLVNPTVGCFHDGVAFPELYLASKKRVMWVLKNSYDDCDDNGNPVSDGMDVRDWFCDSAWEIAGHKPIFIKMALASYCIQNGGAYSEDLLSEKVSVMRSLKEIALVDLSKLPGGTSISDKELKKEFSYFPYETAIQLLKQIEKYKAPFEKMLIFASLSNEIKNCIDDYWKDMEDYIKNDLLGVEAEQLMTIFVYIISKAQIEDILVHCKLIQLFTTTMTKSSMIGYYYSNAEASVNYIQTLKSVKELFKGSGIWSSQNSNYNYDDD